MKTRVDLQATCMLNAGLEIGFNLGTDAIIFNLNNHNLHKYCMDEIKMCMFQQLVVGKKFQRNMEILTKYGNDNNED